MDKISQSIIDGQRKRFTPELSKEFFKLCNISIVEKFILSKILKGILFVETGDILGWKKVIEDLENVDHDPKLYQQYGDLIGSLSPKNQENNGINVYEDLKSESRQNRAHLVENRE